MNNLIPGKHKIEEVIETEYTKNIHNKPIFYIKGCCPDEVLVLCPLCGLGLFDFLEPHDGPPPGISWDEWDMSLGCQGPVYSKYCIASDISKNFNFHHLCNQECYCDCHRKNDLT